MHLKNHMTKIDEIWEISFYQAMFENARKVMKRSLENPPKSQKNIGNALAEWRKSGREKLTNADQYYVDVFYQVSNLNHVLDRLKQARYLIARSPKAFRNSSFSINRNDWSDYHFYVYTTSLASILDCALLITAEVFRLGLPPRHCTFDVVTQHRWVAGSEVSKALRSLKKTLDQHIQRRNRFVHRGEQSSFHDLTDPDGLILLRAVTFIGDRGTDLIPRKTVSSIWKLQMKELRQSLDGIEDRVLEKTYLFLERLLPVYKQCVNSFNATD